MSDVILDGEAVQFEGPLPSGAVSVFNFIVEALEPHGRCLTTFRVDGEDWLSGASFQDHANEPFRRVEALSAPLGDVLLRLIAQVRASTSGLRERMQRYAENLLVTPWPELIGECGKISKAFLPMAHLLGVLGAHDHLETSPWQEKRKALLDSIEGLLNRYADFAEKPDMQGMSAFMGKELIPWVEGYWQWVNDTVAPALAQEHVQNKLLRN